MSRLSTAACNGRSACAVMSRDARAKTITSARAGKAGMREECSPAGLAASPPEGEARPPRPTQNADKRCPMPPAALQQLRTSGQGASTAVSGDIPDVLLPSPLAALGRPRRLVLGKNLDL